VTHPDGGRSGRCRRASLCGGARARGRQMARDAMRWLFGCPVATEQPDNYVRYGNYDDFWVSEACMACTRLAARWSGVMSACRRFMTYPKAMPVAGSA
jgi:hypothetical protein